MSRMQRRVQVNGSGDEAKHTIIRLHWSLRSDIRHFEVRIANTNYSCIYDLWSPNASNTSFPNIWSNLNRILSDFQVNHPTRRGVGYWSVNSAIVSGSNFPKQFSKTFVAAWKVYWYYFSYDLDGWNPFWPKFLDLGLGISIWQLEQSTQGLSAMALRYCHCTIYVSPFKMHKSWSHTTAIDWNIKLSSCLVSYILTDMHPLTKPT